MAEIPPLTSLAPSRFDRPDILKALNAASRQLAELKGVAASMPNQGILISTLGHQGSRPLPAGTAGRLCRRARDRPADQ
jgi:hypothetical protein